MVTQNEVAVYVNKDDVENNVNGSRVIVQQKQANPSTLGLLGYGMTIIMLSVHNAGFFPLQSMVLGMGLMYGGAAQFIAGILEFQQGNTYAFVVFTSYGLYWAAEIILLVFPELGIASATSGGNLAWYFGIWCCFTIFMTIPAFRYNYLKVFILGSLALLFFLSTIAEALNSSIVKKIAGYEGFISGAAAMYMAFADVINEEYGRIILPYF